ncbi:PEP-CTERM sorting domain-containing protein [Rhodovulum strictum]|uniref:VPLPA-CTERM protein sorting domain-containing protein n=1 Tax=Rhodovulum strictum TaxID=58314 RepID=A0A844BBS0_9RHOB|nr:PEP-CTERM sorting domain-containing protein [Rhodovulum strictum]MRH20078.1 hypothetical protein [Rhodovulum strictum]
MRKGTKATAAAALLFLAAGAMFSTPWSRGDAAVTPPHADPAPGLAVAQLVPRLYLTAFVQPARQICLRPQGGLCLPIWGGQCFAAIAGPVAQDGPGCVPGAADFALSLPGRAPGPADPADRLAGGFGPFGGSAGLPWQPGSGPGSEPAGHMSGLPMAAGLPGRDPWGAAAPGPLGSVRPVTLPVTGEPGAEPGAGGPSVVPLPPSLVLVLAGLGALGLVGRRRR